MFIQFHLPHFNPIGKKYDLYFSIFALERYVRINQARSVEENLGIARDTSALFPSFVAQDIYDRSVEEFQDLDIVSPGGNPDFAAGGNLLDSRNFNLFGNVSSQIDKPNEKGPNLIAPDINDPTFTNTDQSSTQFENRGFGWRDARNDPGTETARIGEYFSKHYNSTGNAQANIPVPVLGEAKSPDSDTNIQYDQP